MYDFSAAPVNKNAPSCWEGFRPLPSHIDFLPKRLLLAVAACCWPRLQAADLERLAV